MFEIHTLRLGELLVPLGGSILRDPIHAWYATDGRTRILIDSGMPDAGEVSRRLKIKAKGGGHSSLIEALAAVGTTPDEIDYLVLTHLHFDHAWNLDLFPKVSVVVQRDEVFHAVDPVPTQRIYYLRESLVDLLGRKRGETLRLIEGDLEICEGVRLLKVPGHTPGMQAVVLTTAKGRVALVSDLGDHYRNWFPHDPRASDSPMRYLTGSHLPGAIRSESERDYATSMARVRAASDIVVPAHDFRIPVKIPEQWFDIPDSTEGDLSHKVDGAAE